MMAESSVRLLRRRSRDASSQSAPPLGMRPRLPPEPGPQRSDRTVRRSTGADPSLTLVSLAGGDATDDTTVVFLLKEALLAQVREEQARVKERKKVEAGCALCLWHQCGLADTWKQVEGKQRGDDGPERS